MKPMTKCFYFSLLALTIGCGPQPIDRNAALNHLKADLEKLRQAVLHEDHATVAELTYPPVVKMLGGRDQFVERLTSIAAEIKEKGFRFDSVDISESLDFREYAGCLYSVVSKDLHLVSTSGSRINAHGYLVGVSSDRGTTWKFLDGEGFGTDRKRLEMVLPDFPNDLKLPELPKAEIE